MYRPGGRRSSIVGARATWKHIKMSQKSSHSIRHWGAFISVCSLFASACSKPPVESPKAEPEPVQAPAAQAEVDNNPGQANIKISPRIAEACGIAATDTYFGYNSAKVTTGADDLLQKLATCFTTGPLAGKTMSLVGHTDPRGDDEYNMTLGGRRADSVKSALVAKQLPTGQIQTTSRGEMEASGNDDASWNKDRRVEIALVD
jgi:peptidoglycan-associated lipoprotein